ncbi:hypothetical protein HF324_32410 [Chitinophaga oryzae]|uniref:Lipoprotein n=1 Tax=Chitinophaga oryzae TaxID=2725414 RepID=A0ABX6LQJ4_9BACT|nr:hypothetical protein [Chitinophaga oryzae]QJB42293.1 hypothetical protein HF324_32410 [Chitinophaga oryzae]
MNTSTGHCLYQITRTARTSLLFTFFLYACNQGIPGKTTADSTIAASRSDTVATTAPARGQLSVELTGITEAEFGRHQPPALNQVEYDTARFRVASGELALPTDQAGAVVLKNNAGVPHDEDRLSYHYLGYLKPLHKYLVEVNRYEQDYVLLIDKVTGKKDTVSNFPVLSPDGRLIVSKRYNPYEEYEHIPPPTEDISIYTVDNPVIKRIFLQPSRWMARELYWKDNHTIYIKTWQKEGDDAATSDYLRMTVTSEKDTLQAAPVNASWKGTYVTVLHASGDDAGAHIEVALKVEGNTVTFTESGFQVNNKYLLAATEMDGQLFFTFKKVLEGGDVLVKSEKRFGRIEKEEGKYILYCPYLDEKENGGHRMSYPLKKK